MPTVYPPNNRVVNKGACCCSCPVYYGIEAVFPADNNPYTDPPQKIKEPKLNCKNSSNNTIATYDIDLINGQYVEDYQTGFTDLPILLNGEQVGTLTWETENTDTGIIGTKFNQGTLIFRLNYGQPAYEYPPNEQTAKREPSYNCTYRAENVSINRYMATGLGISGVVTQ